VSLTQPVPDHRTGINVHKPKKEVKKEVTLMKSQAFVMPFAPTLHASFEGKPWIIMIRRTDGKSHGQFFDYHDKEFTQKDIKKFIPNFDSLKWRKVEIDDPLLDT